MSITLFHITGVIVACIIVSLIYRFKNRGKDYDYRVEENFIMTLYLMVIWEITLPVYLFYRLFKWIAGIK
jgi:hypothetical protein